MRVIVEAGVAAAGGRVGRGRRGGDGGGGRCGGSGGGALRRQPARGVAPVVITDGHPGTVTALPGI